MLDTNSSLSQVVSEIINSRKRPKDWKLRILKFPNSVDVEAEPGIAAIDGFFFREYAFWVAAGHFIHVHIVP